MRVSGAGCTGAASDTESALHALHPDDDRAIAVAARVPALGGRDGIVLRIESIAGHAPAIARRAGNQGISGGVVVHPHGADESAGGRREFDRNRLVFYGESCVGVGDQIGVVESHQIARPSVVG